MTADAIEPTAPRILPPLDDVNRPFWTGGERGQLLIQRCESCRSWVHPPAPSCPRCGGAVEAEPVSGRGTVFTFTVNSQAFHPDVPPPYVVALVELVEQADLRLPTNVIDCDPATVVIDLPVEVVFEHHGDHWVPLFRPT